MTEAAALQAELDALTELRRHMRQLLVTVGGYGKMWETMAEAYACLVRAHTELRLREEQESSFTPP